MHVSNVGILDTKKWSVNKPLPLLLHLKNFLTLLPFSISFPYLFSPSTYCICLPFICHSPFILILLNQLALFFWFFHPVSPVKLFHIFLPFLIVFLIYFLFSHSPYFISFSWGFLCLPFPLLPANFHCPVLIYNSFTFIFSASILSLLSLLSFHNLLPFLRPLLVYGPYTKLNPVH